MIECGVAYFGVRRLKHVYRDLEDMASHGVTYVVHTFGEVDWSLYYETMRAIVRATHEVGLKAWLDPWGLGYVFAGDCDSPYAVTHPELAQVDQHGNILPGTCPNRPEFVEFSRQWIDAALALEPDMLFWDEPHLYLPEWFQQVGKWGCRCKLCKQLYQERYGEGMPTDENDPGITDFKAKTLLSYLNEVLVYAKAQGARNSIVLLPEIYQKKGLLDWESIANLKSLDNLGTDPYPFPSWENQPNLSGNWREFVSDYATRIVDLCRARSLENHLWIQGFSLPSDDRGYLEGVIDLAVSQGITNLAVWGFDGHRDMSRFVCQQPDKVWEQIGQGFRRVHEVC